MIIHEWTRIFTNEFLLLFSFVCIRVHSWILPD